MPSEPRNRLRRTGRLLMMERGNNRFSARASTAASIGDLRSLSIGALAVRQGGQMLVPSRRNSSKALDR